jgi:hypothetical protein
MLRKPMESLARSRWSPRKADSSFSVKADMNLVKGGEDYSPSQATTMTSAEDCIRVCKYSSIFPSSLDCRNRLRVFSFRFSCS